MRIVWVKIVPPAFKDPPESYRELQHFSLIYHSPGFKRQLDRLFTLRSGFFTRTNTLPIRTATAGGENKASFFNMKFAALTRCNILLYLFLKWAPIQPLPLQTERIMSRPTLKPLLQQDEWTIYSEFYFSVKICIINLSNTYL